MFCNCMGWYLLDVDGSCICKCEYGVWVRGTLSYEVYSCRGGLCVGVGVRVGVLVAFGFAFAMACGGGGVGVEWFFFGCLVLTCGGWCLCVCVDVLMFVMFIVMSFPFVLCVSFSLDCLEVSCVFAFVFVDFCWLCFVCTWPVHVLILCSSKA